MSRLYENKKETFQRWNDLLKPWTDSEISPPKSWMDTYSILYRDLHILDTELRSKVDAKAFVNEFLEGMEEKMANMPVEKGRQLADILNYAYLKAERESPFKK